MARTLRMPTETDLPPGPVRDFVELLFRFYREARRPTLREISDTILKGDYVGTASPETIRRMLRGTTVPAHWETVEAVYRALCELAAKDPEGRMTLGRQSATIRAFFEQRWHYALDNPEMRYVQFGDEPPF